MTTRRVLVPMGEEHYEWLLTYARKHEISVEASVRIAIRAHNMLYLTPGAWQAVMALQAVMPKLLPEEPA